jgi:hypothetical protein
MISPSVCNDLGSVWTTNSTYAGNASSGLSVGTASEANGVQRGLIANLPFSHTQMISSVSSTLSLITSRVVSVSLRVWPRTTELNAGGVSYAYADPEGDALVDASGTTGVSYNGVSTLESTEIGILTMDSMVELVIYPTQPGMFTYTNAQSSAVVTYYPWSEGQIINDNNDGNPGGTLNCGAPTAAIWLQAAAGNAQNFYFEYVVHVEYAGTGVSQSLMTKNSADPIGLDIVQDIIATAQRNVAQNPCRTFGFTKAVKKEIKDRRIALSPF